MVDITYSPIPAPHYQHPSREKAIIRFTSDVEKYGGVVIGQWVNSRTPIKCICNQGHSCWPRPDFITSHKNRNIIDVSICPKCSMNNRHNPNSDIAHRRFMNKIDELGVILIDNVWKGVISNYWIICHRGHDCFPTGKSINEGYYPCRQCTYDDRSENAENEFISGIESMGGTIIGKYLGAHISVECMCINHHRNMVYPMNIHMGMGMCKVCSMVNSTVFYILSNGVNIKFGITSGTGKSRLYGHARDGYRNIIAIKYNLPPMLAAEIEKECKIELHNNGYAPLMNHLEYFTKDSLSIVISVMQRFIGEI